VIEKVLEAFFRHWLLILLPIFVLPVVMVAAVFSTPPQYQATAGMWVEHPTYLSYASDEFNRYVSPAYNQRNRLMELMRTRTFLTEIASQTALSQMAVGLRGSEELAAIFARDFDAFASGDHLLVLRFRAEDRALAIAVLERTVAVFKSRAAADRYGQAQVAISFYQTRLAETESALVAARNNLAGYTAETRVASILSKGGVDAARLDPPFAEAVRRVETAQRDADAARSSLDRAVLDVAAGAQVLELGFRIVDPVQASDSASRQLRKALVYPVAALLAGLVLGASLLLLFALSDHSVRSLADLAPDTVIVGVLPHLRPEGLARRPGPAVTRRAVGFVAGAPMPLRGRRARRAS
jgi:capsular polysaccharide biosynthesis protein